MDATHAAEIGGGVQGEPRRRQVVGVIARVLARIRIGDVDLQQPRAIALERHDGADRGDEIAPAEIGRRVVDRRERADLPFGEASERLPAGSAITLAQGVPVGHAQEVADGAAIKLVRYTRAH
jgi:hypothetical protein